MTEDLMRKAAAALEQGIDPLSGAFLREHSVAADDCFALAETIAVLLRAYLAASPAFKAGMLMMATFGGSPGLQRVVEARLGEMLTDANVNRLITELQSLNRKDQSNGC